MMYGPMVRRLYIRLLALSSWFSRQAKLVRSPPSILILTYNTFIYLSARRDFEQLNLAYPVRQSSVRTGIPTGYNINQRPPFRFSVPVGVILYRPQQACLLESS